MSKTFKDLTVWQKSFNLVEALYEVASSLPDTERYALSDQLRRSAISIPSNIAEGSKRGTPKNFTQFLRTTYGSAAELETPLLLVNRLYNVDVENQMKVLTEVQKMLSRLIPSLKTINR